MRPFAKQEAYNSATIEKLHALKMKSSRSQDLQLVGFTKGHQLIRYLRKRQWE